MMKSRREFLRDTCSACLGTAFLGLTLNSCAPIPVFKTTLSGSDVVVPLSSFDESKLLIIRDLRVQYDILLVRHEENRFTALYLRCTHRENPLTVSSGGIHCPAHGSRFDLDGNVTEEPALRPLKQFTTSFSDNQITVNLKS